MSGVQKIQRPVRAMMYTGQMAKDYSEFRDMLTSGQINTTQMRSAVERLNQKQTQYNTRLEKTSTRRAFEKEQREAFEALYRKEQ